MILKINTKKVWTVKGRKEKIKRKEKDDKIECKKSKEDKRKEE